MEEYGQGEDARVAGYGLAYDDRAELSSVEGDFRLSSESAESARRLYEISPRSAGVRHARVVWLDEAADGYSAGLSEAHSRGMARES